MERKIFLRLLVASATSGSVMAFIESCKKNSDSTPQGASADFTLDLSSSANSSLLSSGGFVISNSVIVINNSGSYVALSDICTHQSCGLGYNSSTSRLTCPCHGSQFTLSGSVATGPASAPLKVYSVSKSGNILHITG